MAIDFPDSPSDNDIYTVNGKRWIYSSGKWSIYGSTAPDATASDTEPTGVGDGHIWYRSNQSQTLIRYDNTWVEVGSAGGFDNASTNFPTSLDSATGFAAVEALQAKVGVNSSAVTSSLDYKVSTQSVVPYADASARTTAVPSPVEGQMSYLQDTNKVEVYDGSAWVAIGAAGIGSNVVYATTTTSTTTSSTSYVDTALSATITPTSASSKVLFMVSANYLNGPNSITRPGYSIARGNAATGTVLSSGAYGFAQVYQTQDIPHQINVAFMGVDSPATTSAQTYTVVLRTNQSAVSVSGDQNLTLIEVAG